MQRVVCCGCGWRELRVSGRHASDTRGSRVWQGAATRAVHPARAHLGRSVSLPCPSRDLHRARRARVAREMHLNDLVKEGRTPQKTPEGHGALHAALLRRRRQPACRLLTTATVPTIPLPLKLRFSRHSAAVRWRLTVRDDTQRLAPSRAQPSDGVRRHALPGQQRRDARGVAQYCLSAHTTRSARDGHLPCAARVNGGGGAVAAMRC